jgi:aldehyde:ferredoxin oxidoreductase
MNETLLTGVSTCQACVIACGRKVTLPGEAEGKGPEYETIVGFGPQLLIDDLAAITRLGRWCDAYGLDTISMSNVIGLAYLLYAEGRLTRADAGGALEWGDAVAAERLIHLTARREGLGDLLAQGARALGRHFGAEEMAVQVNNLEVAYHDPRGSSGMALVYATSPRGACHNQSDYYMVDVIRDVREQIGTAVHDRHAGAEKAASVAAHQDWRTLHNALVQCLFANVPPETTLNLVNAATGFDYALAELRVVGERAWNLKRAINHRLGLTRANDTLPKALLKPYTDGGAAGFAPDFPAMLSAYYAARGWDEATGQPTRGTLERLDLASVAGDLAQIPAPEAEQTT